MLFHNCNMDRVTRRQPLVSEDNRFRAFHRTDIDRQHLVDDPAQSIECQLNGIAPVDRNIAVQDFLKHFSICNQALALTDQLFKPTLSVDFVRMGCSDQIHRNVGVDQNQGCGPEMYPLSISANIRSMSAVG